MENEIKQIIQSAKMLRSEGYSDKKIAEFVHIELGKTIYYDNNYTAKIENDKVETILSQNRKKNMLKANTDKSSKAQICKGMAEIYAEILNEVGIEARVFGVEKKGDIQEVHEDKARHYYVKFKIEEQEYVQDYLMESALMRIKIGEAEISENMPGICRIEEYQERGLKNLMQTELSHEYLKNVFEKSIYELSDRERLNAIFQKLNEHFENENTTFGFEEAKDFVFLMGKYLMKDKSKIKFINLVKERESECGIVCIYEIDGKKFLVRGEDERSDISFQAGEISNNDLQEILNQGYEGRSSEDRSYLQLEQVRQNNQKINKIINEIIEIRKNADISLQDGDKLETIAQSIFQLETKKCIEIYKAEYGQYGFLECRGANGDVYLNPDPKKMGDCSGGTKGLGIGISMSSFLGSVYGLLEKLNVQKSGAEFTQNYDGSERDQMDFLLYLKETNGIDMNYVLGALTHEAKHTYGLIGGNTFIKEGITEQTTREDCDKYGMYMSPTSHTQEANFIRKLELVVGRDEVVKAGLYDEHVKMKESRLRGLAERDRSVTIDELNEFFEISRYDDSKIDEYDKAETDESKKLRPKLEKFRKAHPELIDEITSIRNEYDKMNQFDRYNSISKKFNKVIPQIDFRKLIEKLDVLYDIQMQHKQEPDFYRALYSKDWNELLSDNELKMLSDSDGELDKEEGINLFGNGKKIKSYADLVAPINEYIRENNLDLTKDRRKMMSTIPNLKDVIEIQNSELEQLQSLREKQQSKGESTVSMQSLVRNALEKENTRIEEVKQADRVETREQENSKEGVSLDDD